MQAVAAAPSRGGGTYGALWGRCPHSLGGGGGGYNGVPPITGCTSLGVVGASSRAHGGAPSSKNRGQRPGGNGGSSPGGGRSILLGPRGGIIFQEPGTPPWGGRGVQPRGWSDFPSGPMGRHHLPKNRAHRPGGNGGSSPRGGRSTLLGLWGGIIFQELGTPAWVGRGAQSRGWSEYPSGPMGSHHLPRTGHTGLGGTGSPAQGVVGASFRAHGESSSINKRAHRPEGNGESSPGGGRSTLQGLWGGIIFQEPDRPAWGGRGVQPRGWSEYPSGPTGRHHLPRTGHTGLGGTGSPAQGVVGASFRAHGEALSSKNRAHRRGEDGESSAGGGRSILQGPWGGIIFQEPGTPARGGRGVQPRGWSEHPSGPTGSHHLPITGHTGLGGMGGPAQGVIGASFRAHGEASSSENRAHWPGGDGRSSPGGGRSILQGSRGVRESARGFRGSRPWGGRCALQGRWGGSRLVGFRPPAWGSGEPRSGAGSNEGAPSGGRFQRGARASWGVARPLPVGGRCCVP